MEEITMTKLLKTGLATLLAIALATGAAQAFDLKGGGQVKLKPTSAQLGIISPANNVCPGPAKLTAWIQTNKPGTLQIDVTTSKGANGVIMGSYSKPMNIVAPINAEYRVVIPGTSVTSNWAPLVAQC
jgi:hypothetical protein